MPLPTLSPTGVFTAWITPPFSDAGTGITGAIGQVPNSTNPPIIFEPYWTLTDGMPEVWIIASGDATWGGAQVFVSLDNTTYTSIGVVVDGAAQGVLSSSFASGADPDTVNTLSVDLSMSLGRLISGTAVDADFMLPTLAYCDGELISFSNAILTGPSTYDLDTYIRRGCYRTEIASHASGTDFGWIQSPFSYTYPVTLIGTTVWFKFPAFNTLGTQLQDISVCTAYPYTLTGFGWKPAVITETKTANYTISSIPNNAGNGTHYNNCTTVTDIIITLPTAVKDLTYGFLVCEPFYLRVKAAGTDIISRGSGEDSAAGGFIRSNLPCSFVLVECHETGHWVVASQVGTWSIDT